MSSLRLRAPGKLNLLLRIVGRRADGYHLLQTVFEPIDWCDELRLRRRRDGRIVRRHGSTTVAAEADLAVRAARLLQAESGSPFGVDLSIVKRLPMGAGLGGGSADAAAVLRGLNTLWRLYWPLPRLEALGARLGADVAALVRQRPCWAEGVGDQLQDLPLPPRHYVVIFPGVASPTAAIYQAPELVRDAAPLAPAAWLAAPLGDNAFEPLLRRREPAVAAALDWLDARLPGAHLTGSGSALYAVAPDRATARRVARQCPPGWLARACRSWRAS